MTRNIHDESLSLNSQYYVIVVNVSYFIRNKMVNTIMVQIVNYLHKLIGVDWFVFIVIILSLVTWLVTPKKLILWFSSDKSDM